MKGMWKIMSIFANAFVQRKITFNNHYNYHFNYERQQDYEHGSGQYPYPGCLNG